MLKIAQAYDDNRSRIVSEYFEKQKWVSTHSKLEQKYIKIGKKLSKSCVDCHGKDGKVTMVAQELQGNTLIICIMLLLNISRGKEVTLKR